MTNSVFGAVIPGASLAIPRRSAVPAAPGTAPAEILDQRAPAGSLEPAAPEIIATGIRRRPNTLFAASAGSARGGSSSGELPPAGSGGAGSGDGPKADPVMLGDDLEAFLEAGTRDDLMLRRVQGDLKHLGTDEDRLSYLAHAGSLLSTPAASKSFQPEAIIELAHAISRRAERLTPFVTPDGILLRSDTDIHNLMHHFYIAAHQQEEALLRQQTISAELAARVADIRFAFTRRGLLFYAHMMGGRESYCRPSRVALMLLDLEHRYQALCLGRRSLEARTLLRELREPLGIHWQEEPWAVADVQEQIRANMALIARELGEITRLMLMLRAHDTVMNNCLHGIYSYSPRVFAESALELRKLAIALPPSGLARNVLLRKALEHETRANRELLMASHLGLSSPPEDI